jgi:hypothetical protein
MPVRFFDLPTGSALLSRNSELAFKRSGTHLEFVRRYIQEQPAYRFLMMPLPRCGGFDQVNTHICIHNAVIGETV